MGLRRSPAKRIMIYLGVVALGYLLLVAFVGFKQRSLLYFPVTLSCRDHCGCLEEERRNYQAAGGWKNRG